MTAAHEITDLSADRITWSRLSNDQIEALASDAGAYGDLDLARRARRALARRARRS